jgi:hypothetical protein
MLQVFLDGHRANRCPSVRHVVCSGEELPGSLQQKFFECFPQSKLSNLYGPTETAVDVTVWECRKEDGAARVPIGRPIANTQIYVLDEYGEPAPRGVTGELYIGGVQVGRGYLNRPNLTAERFVANPYGAAGSRMYRTGDRARYRGDGQLEYWGRADQQVKIRGFRIEPGEIETTLLRYPGIQRAVVLAREDESGEKRLVGYVVQAPDAEPVSPTQLREHLKSKVPEYMIPAAWVVLDELPLTPNGKVDRHRLPEPQMSDPLRYVAPRTPTEEVLAQIWAEVLKLDQVGVEEDFFELGGHSLLATQVITRVRNATQLDVEVRTLFEAPTITEFALRLTALQYAKESEARSADEALQAKVREMTDDEVARELQRLTERLV